LAHLLSVDYHERQQLYDKALALREEGLGPWRIADLIGVNRNTVGGWIYGRTKPSPVWNLKELNECPELSYVLGVALGDGTAQCTLNTKGKRTYMVILQTHEQEFAQIFSEAASKIFKGGYHAKITSINTVYGLRYICTIRSKQLYLLCKKGVPSTITEKYPAMFLRGFYDAEGCVTFSWRGGRLYKKVILSNCSHDLIQYCREKLAEIGIPTTIHVAHIEGKTKLAKDGHYIISRKPIYYLGIGKKKAIINFAKYVGFSLSRKKQKLIMLLNELDKINGRW
jgi:intein-encoded DNA endonuclease-like protein